MAYRLEMGHARNLPLQASRKGQDQTSCAHCSSGRLLSGLGTNDALLSICASCASSMPMIPADHPPPCNHVPQQAEPELNQRARELESGNRFGVASLLQVKCRVHVEASLLYVLPRECPHFGRTCTSKVLSWQVGTLLAPECHRPPTSSAP